MRYLLLLVLVAVGMSLAGWLTFGHEPGRLSITVEASRIRDDTTRLVARGKEVVDGATDEWKAKRDRDTSHPRLSPPDHL